MTPTPRPKRIVYLDRDSLPRRIQIPAPVCPHEWVNYPTTRAQDAIERCQNADVIVSNKVPISREILQACPSVGHIAVTATGYNIIDIEACRELGISVSNIPSYAATTVSEHVIASALTLRRNLQHYQREVIAGAWQKSPRFCVFGQPIHNLADGTIGIIGLGQIGTATAKLARAFGMNVIHTSRQRRSSKHSNAVTLDQLLQSSDIISVHCSLTPETENLIAAAEIDRMQNHTILINTARGGIVNEQDAADAIKRGRLGGLAFDVLGTEPPADDNPLLSIANRSEVILTPHIAWASEQAMQHLANILSANIDAFLAGTPQNVVENL